MANSESAGTTVLGISLQVSMKEMEAWPVGRINQFFEGVKMALDAIGGVPNASLARPEEAHLPCIRVDRG